MTLSSKAAANSITTLSKLSEIEIINCGTSFINGVYVRSEKNQFTRHCQHPSQQKVITLEIRKQSVSHSLHVPPTYFDNNNNSNDDDDVQVFVIACIDPCIHYYLCIHCLPACIHTNHTQSQPRPQWIAIGGTEPLPHIRGAIHDLSSFFEAPFVNSEEYLRMSLTQTVKTRSGGVNNNKSLVLLTDSHFRKYKRAIHSSWIELGYGLKGGRCLKLEMNHSHRVWDVLAEVASMNGLSPWRVRLRHVDSGLYVHYLWQYTLHSVLQLVEHRTCNRDIISNRLVFHASEHWICFFSAYDDTKSYQSRYLPCSDNIARIQFEIDKHEKYLDDGEKEKQKEVDDDIKMPMDDDDDPPMIYQYLGIDPREKHKFYAERVCDPRTLNVYFGDKFERILLEECCVGCECWVDAECGCRIAYIIQHVFDVPIQKQGWIVLPAHELKDYLDEDVSQYLFAPDAQSATLIMYVKVDSLTM